MAENPVRIDGYFILPYPTVLLFFFWGGFGTCQMLMHFMCGLSVSQEVGPNQENTPLIFEARMPIMDDVW